MHLLKCIMLFSATVNFQQNIFSWKQNALKRYWNKRNMLLLLWQSREYFKYLLYFHVSFNMLPSLMNKNFILFLPILSIFFPRKIFSNFDSWNAPVNLPWKSKRRIKNFLHLINQSVFLDMNSVHFLFHREQLMDFTDW